MFAFSICTKVPKQLLGLHCGGARMQSDFRMTCLGVFFQLWCSPKCLHIKWASKSCPSDSRIGCKRVPTFVARLRRSNRPKISRSAAAAGCVGVAVWHVFVLESTQKMNGCFFCHFFKQKLGRGPIDFRPNKRTIHTGNPFLTSNRVYHRLGALPPDPRQGVTPWTPFFLLIKGTDID
jgi:hypothetical protein